MVDVFEQFFCPTGDNFLVARMTGCGFGICGGEGRAKPPSKTAFMASAVIIDTSLKPNLTIGRIPFGPSRSR